MMVRLAISLIQAWRDAREEERHKTTHVVPGLGEFTSSDGELWFGEVDDIQVSLTTQGRPPSEAQARRRPSRGAATRTRRMMDLFGVLGAFECFVEANLLKRRRPIKKSVDRPAVACLSLPFNKRALLIEDVA